MSEYHVRAELD